MNNKDKEWEDYLLSIGVTNLNDEVEINRKLEEVERGNPEFQIELQAAIKDAVSYIKYVPESKERVLRKISRDEVQAWLESLAN